MSFALACRSKNKTEDSKSLTSTKPSSYYHNNDLAHGCNDSFVHLHRAIGNQPVQRLTSPSNDVGGFNFAKIEIIQPNLMVNQPNDTFEQEADRVAEQVMRMSIPNVIHLSSNNEDSISRKCIACGTKEDDGEEKLLISRKPLHMTNIETTGAIVDESAAIRSGSGSPLESSTREFMESRFGYDFSHVRIYDDSKTNELADSISARAFTYDKEIFLGSNTSKSDRELIAHELVHVIQQRAHRTPKIQRDLKAYNKPRTEVLPTLAATGGGTSYIEMTAEAPGIRNALSGLITDGKIKEVKSTDGNTSWFAAEHHKNVQLDEILEALQKAGYARSDKLARAIYDIHGEFLYTNQELTTIMPFYSRTTSLGEKVEIQTDRSMTEWEIRQAKRVFGNAIDYSKVTLAEGSISAKIGAAGGYARTVGNTVYLPPGGSRDMAWIVHELTHVWQYQTTGWTYAPKAIWAQMTEGYSYTESGKTAEQSLKDARAAGKTLYDYNKEQQGDIISDYYRHLQKREDISAWQPFIDDIKSKA